MKSRIINFLNVFQNSKAFLETSAKKCSLDTVRKILLFWFLSKNTKISKNIVFLSVFLKINKAAWSLKTRENIEKIKTKRLKKWFLKIKKFFYSVSKKRFLEMLIRFFSKT